MEPDPREATGDLGYDMAHEVTGGRSRPQEETPQAAATAPPDDGAGDLGYDEAHDFRR
jgi:hypothetical protein